MAAELQPCDKDLWAFGDTVGVYAANCGAERFERAIKAAKILTDERIDWHYAGGRAVVKCEQGRVNKCQAAVNMLVECMEKYSAHQPQSTSDTETSHD